jgi:hypothetical protein
MTDKEINTKGGAAVEGDANVGRDFIGRDAINSRTTTISGHTIVAVAAVLIVGAIGVIAVIRLGPGTKITTLPPVIEQITPALPGGLATSTLNSPQNHASILP